ncbi:hypothetical protein GpartN1_g755.t1 [Galdieria partita]|uniref:Chromosome segregation in meiosis protein 3 domain-containing protein n=1 Tax=Galdieria partita TaxID=83374 RepID=A0A9C7UMT1_9RHOD|nr:hypothetical protein GpartN1_g755.t1 [Galdieria partita]
MSLSKEKRVQLNEESLLNQRYGIPQLIRDLETLQRDCRLEDSLEIIGNILQIWHMWANKLSPNMEFGRFLSRLQALQSLKGIKSFLADQRERKIVSNFETTNEDIPVDSKVLIDTPISPCISRRNLNSIEDNIVDTEHLSDSFSEGFVEVDGGSNIEPTQEFDFSFEDCEQDK